MLNHIIRLDAKKLIDTEPMLKISKKRIEKEFPLHWHDFFEFDIIISGNGFQNFNGKKYPLKKGIAYILRPTDFHGLYADEPIELYNIMFHESILSDEFTEMLLNMPEDILTFLNDDIFNKISFTAELLKDEYSHDFRFRNKYIKNLMESALFLFIREFKPVSRNDYTAAVPIKKSLVYIHLHFRENPPLSLSAKISGFCPNYFSELFHKHTGCTYTEYLTRLKLNYAKRLLESCDITSTDVCFECGFTSLSNFLRAFKLNFGISPQKYADKYRGSLAGTE
jgi:AraC-like DNA-binding protein